jgi:GH15 family glucan-1,4-alpha-glucosidase
MTSFIEDYALIGDCESAALVSRSGSIDWLCWPRFDSPACFAALLGDSSHGRWLIAPSGPARKVTRAYREDTLILETVHETETGVVRVVDFMPLRTSDPDLIRLVIGERGRVSMRTELVVRFGYGAYIPWVTHTGPDTWRAIAGPDMVVLRTPAPMHGENLKSVAEFTVSAGETVPFVLSYSASHLPDPPGHDVDRALKDTEEFWRSWVARGKRIARWQSRVTRSLITLRALVYEPTGGIIAAPTTSLPERLGGSRNWDYRYCWLRDATQTLLAFMNAGYFEEADAWRKWLFRAIAGSPDQAQIMYGVAGERRLTEWGAHWLPGYERSSPVRIGNAAHTQLQLDVYGEVMDVLHLSRQSRLCELEIAWALQLKLLEHLEHEWQQPDYGIWEVRGPPQHFTYSKILAWVAFDRAIKDAERHGLHGPIEKWRRIRQCIYDEVCTRGFDAKRNCFVQAYDSHLLDASLLLIGPLGFLSPKDPRFIGTIEAVEADLLRDGFVQRYDTSNTDDGLPPGEGAFLACSFWLVDAYALCGRTEEARALFERLLALQNDVGLLAEEYDPTAKRMLGNFPQGFSHLALVNSAFNLAGAIHPAEQRSEHAAEPDTGRLPESEHAAR